MKIKNFQDAQKQLNVFDKMGALVRDIVPGAGRTQVFICWGGEHELLNKSKKNYALHLSYNVYSKFLAYNS